MSEHPAVIAREAKSIHQSLKELLKNKEPFDKEVDFQRKNLRRRYLNLLLVHPTAKESKDVENHLWMQTSYAFIASYKHRISALDRAIQNNQRHQQQQGGQQPRQSNHGVVEHRKLVQRFRQFLAEEEKFWTQLLLRLRRLFDLGEAQQPLMALGLLNESDDAVSSNLPEGAEPRENLIHGSNGRNHFQFPPEDPTLSFVPTTAEDRESRLAILSKALICLGDIARYRELYNESGGKRAGQEDGGSGRRGRGRRGGSVDFTPRPRNYDKARQCYEQARLLVPSEGNPSHQLAIISSYQKDTFSSLVHYYRALCVGQPYDTAAENMSTMLTKALEMWRQKTRRERDKNSVDSQLPPRVRVENFKEKVVALHALWRVGIEKGIEKMKSISPKHNEKVFHEFYTLVSERHLPIDMISSTIVLSQGALWKHRMIRDSVSNPQKADSAPGPPGTTAIFEWGFLDHIMDMHLALLEVGKDELTDPPPVDGVDDLALAQRISATFRRTLPALRIASKWLRANFKYVMQDQEFVAYQEKESAKVTEVKNLKSKISKVSSKTVRFWKTYAQFMLALSQAFPMGKLPIFTAPLEEDIDMRGFLPLRKLMGEKNWGDGDKTSLDVAQSREQVHPNVDQLMRISDLMEDAKALVNLENSPLLLINNYIMFNPEAVEEWHALPSSLLEETTAPVVPMEHQQLLAKIRDNSLDTNMKCDPDADDMTELTSRTDDDPVRDAFQFLNTSENVDDHDDEEEDEIVWDPRASISPVLSPNLHSTPLTPVKPLLSPKSPKSPTQYLLSNVPSAFKTPVAPTATTAQDLLNDVMGLGNASKTLSSMNHFLPSPIDSKSSAPQPKFLFGSELSHRPSQSIWSASVDEQQLLYTSNAAANVHPGAGTGQIYQTPPRQFPTSQDLSQPSIWSSTYSPQSPNSQQSYAGGLPTASFAQPPQSMLPNAGLGGQRVQHKRAPSASAAGPLFQNHGELQLENLGYSSPPQPPIHRPEHSLSQPTSGGYLNHSHSPVAMGGGRSLGGLSPTSPYFSSSSSSYHARQVSLHDPRVGQQNFISAPLSQVWSNTG